MFPAPGELWISTEPPSLAARSRMPSSPASDTSPSAGIEAFAVVADLRMRSASSSSSSARTRAPACGARRWSRLLSDAKSAVETSLSTGSRCRSHEVGSDRRASFELAHEPLESVDEPEAVQHAGRSSEASGAPIGPHRRCPADFVEQRHCLAPSSVAVARTFLRIRSSSILSTLSSSPSSSCSSCAMRAPSSSRAYCRRCVSRAARRASVIPPMLRFERIGHRVESTRESRISPIGPRQRRTRGEIAVAEAACRISEQPQSAEWTRQSRARTKRRRAGRAAQAPHIAIEDTVAIA